MKCGRIAANIAKLLGPVDGGLDALAATPTAAVVTFMLTRIVRPNCGHIGATTASLPRVLICSQCEHGAFIRSGSPPKSPSVIRDEQAAYAERYEPAGTE